MFNREEVPLVQKSEIKYEFLICQYLTYIFFYERASPTGSMIVVTIFMFLLLFFLLHLSSFSFQF